MKCCLNQVARVLRGAFGLALVVLIASVSQAGFTSFEATGTNPAAIVLSRDAFRATIGGGVVAGANGSFGGLRREINWDGVPDAFSDPNALPANFFNVNSPRGVVFNSPGTGFLLSSDAGSGQAPLFGFAADFQTFSPERLFTAVNSNVTDITFFVPGTNTPARTSAFGAVFTDVEAAGLTKIEFFDQASSLIYSRDVLVSGNQGLSFLGAAANAGEQIFRVRLTAGLNTIVSNGVLGNPNDDVVVMDDFIYAEPVPEPGTLALAVLGAFGLLIAARRRK